jgi:ABC transporter substrate binding protein
MTSVVDRRAFVGTVAIGLLAAPLPAEVQQAGKVARVGYLNPGNEVNAPTSDVNVLRQGLRDLGWIEGRTMIIESRFAGDQAEKLSALAMELVQIPVEVLLTVATAATRAGQERDEHHPDRDVSRRRPGECRLRCQPRSARGPSDFPGALQAAVRDRAEALIVVDDALITAHRTLLVGLATKHSLPVASLFPPVAEAGGLIAYGPSTPDLYRRAADYIDRILKGAEPRSLPIEQPTKFHLAVDLKAARALGLTIPQSLLLRADQLIE